MISYYWFFFSSSISIEIVNASLSRTEVLSFDLSLAVLHVYAVRRELATGSKNYTSGLHTAFRRRLFISSKHRVVFADSKFKTSFRRNQLDMGRFNFQGDIYSDKGSFKELLKTMLRHVLIPLLQR